MIIIQGIVESVSLDGSRMSVWLEDGQHVSFKYRKFKNSRAIVIGTEIAFECHPDDSVKEIYLLPSSTG